MDDDEGRGVSPHLSPRDAKFVVVVFAMVFQTEPLLLHTYTYTMYTVYICCTYICCASSSLFRTHPANCCRLRREGFKAALQPCDASASSVFCVSRLKKPVADWVLSLPLQTSKKRKRRRGRCGLCSTTLR
jgi:hypothetical protein